MGAVLCCQVPVFTGKNQTCVFSRLKNFNGKFRKLYLYECKIYMYLNGSESGK